MSYFTGCFKKYADFSGRARRSEYWMFVLFNTLIGFVLFLLTLITPVLSFLYALYGLAVLIPGLAVTVRRLHDVGKSGAWIFISLVPFIGGIWLLVLLCTDSQYETNEYGENPKGYNETASYNN